MLYFQTLARDGTGDYDGDGVSDLDEYRSGTDPSNPASRLRISSEIHNGSTFVLQFNAIAGKSYSVFYRTNVASGAWTKLQDVAPQGVDGTVTVTDSGVIGIASRFYRVVTPGQ